MARNKEKKREYDRLYSKKNRARKRRSQRRWREANRDKLRLYNRTAYLKRRHSEKRKKQVRKANKKWRRAYPDKNIVRSHRYRVRKKKNGGDFTHKQLKSLGNKCMCCGLGRRALARLKRSLSVDHVIPIAHGGRNSVNNLQLLCFGKNGCHNLKGTKHTDYRRKNVQADTRRAA